MRETKVNLQHPPRGCLQKALEQVGAGCLPATPAALGFLLAPKCSGPTGQ